MNYFNSLYYNLNSRLGVGEAGEQLDRFMSSRIDLVEENLQKAAQKSSRLALTKPNE